MYKERLPKKICTHYINVLERETKNQEEESDETEVQNKEEERMGCHQSCPFQLLPCPLLSQPPRETVHKQQKQNCTVPVKQTRQD